MADFVVHDSLADFWTATESFYTADPVRHTVALTGITYRLAHPEPTEDPQVLVTAHDGSKFLGAALRLPPYPLVADAIPVELADDFADVLLGITTKLNAVTGERDQVTAFAAAWSRRTGATATEAMSMRLFRLDTLVIPAVPGRMRLATPDDAELLGPWRAAFMEEAMPHLRRDDDHVAEVRGQVERGNAHVLWEVDGTPVAWAGANRPVNDMTRIGPVYTPPEPRLRGRGHRRRLHLGQERGRHRGPPLHRPRQPHLERRLPAHRLRPGPGRHRTDLHLTASRPLRHPETHAQAPRNRTRTP